MPKQRQKDQVAALLEKLASSHEPGHLADFLYDESKELLAGGYPREMLLDDLRNLVLYLRRMDQGEQADDVLEVVDVLIGWCAPSARI
jgi:hypothetical protein